MKKSQFLMWLLLLALVALFSTACNGNSKGKGGSEQVRKFDIMEDPDIKPGVDDLALDPDFITGSEDWTFDDFVMRLHYTGEITGSGGAKWEMKAEIPLYIDGRIISGEASGQRIYIFEAEEIGCIQKTTIEDVYIAAGRITADCNLEMGITLDSSRDGISTMTCPGVSIDVPFIEAAYFTEPDKDMEFVFPKIVGEDFKIVIEANSTFIYHWQIYLPQKLAEWKDRELGMAMGSLGCDMGEFPVGVPEWPPSIFDEEDE